MKETEKGAAASGEVPEPSPPHQMETLENQLKEGDIVEEVEVLPEQGLNQSQNVWGLGLQSEEEYVA
ncbi:hypothetical protein IRJ41_002818 [Triplophysa rosa]|uniref:Uncharacterized protein n=1 Tax=Triplophysa rosa TaxID=992332 RepID=A0A9W7WSC1_TRIRA|nr:hypothetical protein IRJ41_002818 [Triplophysa rosa]